MKEILLSGKKGAGRVTLVDDHDLALVCAYRWYLWERPRNGGNRPTGPYAATSVIRGGKYVFVLMYGLITGFPMTDHINHDGLDNQRSNLRPTTIARNNHNQRPQTGSSSRYKGVTWHRRDGKWQASIKVSGKYHYLGCFEVEEDAARAYNAAALELFGSHAFLNEVAA